MQGDRYSPQLGTGLRAHARRSIFGRHVFDGLDHGADCPTGQKPGCTYTRSNIRPIVRVKSQSATIVGNDLSD